MSTPLKHLNRLTDFQEIWYLHLAIWGHPNAVHFNSVQSVTTWQTPELKCVEAVLEPSTLHREVMHVNRHWKNMRGNLRKCSVPSGLIAITNEPSEIWYRYGFYTYLHITYEILFVTVVNDYGDDANFEVISDKFNVYRICTQVIKSSQKMKKSNNSNKEIDSLE
jgi:hypothetical protein